MPMLNLLIMPLHIIRQLLNLLPVFVIVGRLLARRHGWMCLVRGNMWCAMHLGALGVIGCFIGRGGVGMPRGSFFVGGFT